MSTLKFPWFTAIALAVALSFPGNSLAQNFDEVDPALTELFEAGKASYESEAYDEAHRQIQ